ncbi:MAG TPA: hypothetical protein VD999_05990 [Vitreimonas sp.]|nr:hypothetical protein [Vitreimonas sp.]
MARSAENELLSIILHRRSLRVEDILEDPSLQPDLPELSASLRKYLAGDWVDIIGRELLTEWGQIPFEFLVEAMLSADALDLPTLSIKHSPATSAHENTTNLKSEQTRIDQVFGPDTEVKVLKTVTASFISPGGPRHHFLISGFGEFQVDKVLLRHLAETIGANFKQRHINNEEVFDPEIELRVVPGLVKPIISPHRLSPLTGICYLHLSEPDQVGAVTATLFDSFLAHVGIWEAALEWYLLEFCRASGVIITPHHLSIPQADIYFITSSQVLKKSPV